MIRLRGGRRPGGWHRVYYLLALFDVIAVAGGLFLTHRIVTVFSTSVSVDKQWVMRLERYSTLAGLATAVVAPGNDVFLDLAPDAEADRLSTAVGVFDRELDTARTDVLNALPNGARLKTAADFNRVAEARRQLVGEALRVFEHLRRREPDLAARRSALMNRQGAELTFGLNSLREDARAMQRQALEEDHHEAEALRLYQLPLGMALLCMVAAATVYGHKISKQVQADESVRESYIAQLRESEASLERRIDERTAQLRDNERRLAQAQQLARLGSWEWDLRTDAMTWSDQTFRLFGLDVDASTPSYERYVAFVHPDDRALVARTVHLTLETHEPFEYDHRLVRADGALRIAHVSGGLVLDEAGVPNIMSGTTQDVTDQRVTDEALRKSEERFQLVARATNEALWDWDITNSTVSWKDGFRRIFGHADAEPTREVWTGLIHPDDAERVALSLHQFLESSNDVWTGEYRFKRHDGRYAWVLDRGIVLRHADGSPQRMIGSFMDITERKESERMKSDFVSFVSHQLRTPLSGMNWMLELAADTQGLPADAREYIADARESANRLVSLVNDLLDIARLESGRTGAVPEAMSLEVLTRSVLHELQPIADDKRHDIALQVGLVAPVWADPQMLRQVVTNLLSNAIKYTPAGGQIAVALQRENGTLQWSVTDNGIGVPRIAQARLFEKFYRADNVLTIEAEGTGLGLHLVRLIVEQAGGRVWCESEEGSGAMFAFTVPVSRPEGESV